MSKPKPAPVVMCPYCDNQAVLVTGEAIYPKRTDLHAKKFYSCAPCGAYVGVHAGTINPLGRLANAQLRRAKIDAHAVFDRLWRGKMKQDATLSKGHARAKAYKWLAATLGMDRKDWELYT